MRRTVLLQWLWLVGAACSGDRAPSEGAAPAGRGPAPEGSASLLLVTIDTCRADGLGCYGNARPTSPAVDFLASRGVRFAQAFAQAPLTLPSHASILTGELPSTHGARTNWEPLADEGVRTLAEELGEAGWETAAVVAGFVLNRRFGLDQGFEHYDDRFDGSYRAAGEVLAGVRTWTAGRDAARPFFLWVHFMDAHGPYTPPPAVLAELGAGPPGELPALEAARRAAILEGRVPGPEEVEGLRRLYDGEIRYVDAVLARMMTELDAAGLLRRAFVVLTADHGEGFGHGYYFDHGDRLYDEQLHVPLVLAGPGLPRGAVVDELVRSVDVLPTVLELLGRPGRAGAGRSLMPLVRGEGGEPRVALAETYLRRAKSYGEHERLAPEERSAGTLFALRSARFKLILTERAGGGASTEVFEVARDPDERQPLAGAQGEAAELERALRAHATAAGPILGRVDPSLAPGELEKLRALGYSADSTESDER